MSAQPQPSSPHWPAATTRVPPLPPAWIARPRVSAAIAAGTEDRVLVVTGGAGTGKTTAVAEWFLHWRSIPGAWLTLDDVHLRPGRLAADLTLVLAGLDDPFDSAVHPRSGATPHDALHVALDALACSARRAVLVIDDIHKAAGTPAEASLRSLFRHAPPTLHLIVTTRAAGSGAPARHGLGRRPAAQVGPATLSFTAEEASRLLRTHGIVLDTRPLSELHAGTEGWAGAIGRAGEAMADQGRLPQLEAATASISDYLVHDVLDDMSEPLRTFALRTSVVDRICAPLAEVLTGDGGARQQLERLAGDGILLSAIDERDHWYRYHVVPRSVLRATLREEDPDCYRGLVRCAAQWFDDRGMAVEADAHAVRGEDWMLVSRLRCRRWVRDMLDGRSRPRTDVPVACLEAAWESSEIGVLLVASAAANGHEHLAAQRRHHLDELVRREERDQAPLVEARLLMDIVYGRAFGADRRARVAVDALNDVGSQDRRVRAFGLLVSAELDLDEGLFSDARNALIHAAHAGRAFDTRWVADEAVALTAVLAAGMGRPEEADRILSGLEAPSGRTGAIATLAEALTTALRGDRVGAADLLDGADELLVAGSRALRLAWHTLQRACATPPNDELAGEDPRTHPLGELVLVALGDLEHRDERNWSVVIGGPPGVALVQATAFDARRWRDTTLLGHEVLRQGSSAHPCAAIEAAVLVAAAELHRGDHPAALEWVRFALEAAEPGRLRAPLLGQRAALRELLAHPSFEVVSLSSDALELRDLLLDEATPAFLEPLTEREQAVLRCLPSLMSNADIAEELVVSVNTVKTHLKAVYRKLGVTRRREAMARARQLGLI